MSIQTEKPTESIDEAIGRLSKLSAIEYETVRENEAKKLNIRVSKLDDFINAEKTSNQPQEDNKSGKAIVFNDCPQWDSEIIGSGALDEALSGINRHMHINPHYAVVSVLWAAHTHVYEAFSHTPRMLITAPEPACGKTVLLFHMVGNLCNKPMPVDAMSVAVFCRLAEGHQCTFLIDEGDVFLNQDSDLVSGFNNGYEAHGNMMKCVGGNDDFEVRAYSTHAPVALAGISLDKKLPKATLSRCHLIVLEKACNEVAENDEWDKEAHQPALLKTRKKIARWTHDNEKNFKSCKPTYPKKNFKNRTKNIWTPLFKIAHIAGGDWPKKAMDAYHFMSKIHEPTKSERFLIDIKVVMPKTGDIHTENLIMLLCCMDDSRYLDFNWKAFEDEKKKIQPKQLSAFLARYGLKPKNVTVRSIQKKGYDGDQLRALLDRYTLVPAEMEILPVHPSDCPPDKGCSENSSVRTNSNRTDVKPLKPLSDEQSDGWTDKSPYLEDETRDLKL